MKAVMMAAQAIKAGDVEAIVAGGMENMSQVPHYIDGRNGVKLGDIKLQDGLLKDGLTDVYSKQHMGVCAEKCAKEYNITREEQDAFAIQSYESSAKAWTEGNSKKKLFR
jgi:acetyl-CoA C-acetyltransferase